MGDRRVFVASILSLFRNLFMSPFDPRLAPRVLFCRRFVADSGPATPVLPDILSCDTDSGVPARPLTSPFPSRLILHSSMTNLALFDAILPPANSFRSSQTRSPNPRGGDVQ
jgi:hypothetical protein